MSTNVAVLKHDCVTAANVVREMLTGVDPQTRDALNAMLDLIEAHMALNAALLEGKS